MPELPEVETVRRDIAGTFLGHKLKGITVTGPRTVRRHPAELLAVLEGSKLAGVGRHGKYLLFEWDDGQVLVGHLRMSGQLLAARPRDPVAPHTHAVLSFSGSRDLRFVDPRTFGELFLAGFNATDRAAEGPPTDEGAREDSRFGTNNGGVQLAVRRVAELDHLGPDALDVDLPSLQSALSGRRAPLKSMLVDQRAVAGIGNIYADEILLRRPLEAGPPGRVSQARRAQSPDGVGPHHPSGRRHRARLVAGRRAVPRSQRRAGPVPARAQGLRETRPAVPSLRSGSATGALWGQKRVLL